MKKLSSILLIFVCITMMNSAYAVTIVQMNCLGDFLECKTSAELEYESATSVIQGGEEQARRNFIRAMQSCVSAYNDCPQM